MQPERHRTDGPCVLVIKCAATVAPHFHRPKTLCPLVTSENTKPSVIEGFRDTTVFALRPNWDCTAARNRRLLDSPWPFSVDHAVLVIGSQLLLHIVDVHLMDASSKPLFAGRNGNEAMLVGQNKLSRWITVPKPRLDIPTHRRRMGMAYAQSASDTLACLRHLIQIANGSVSDGANTACGSMHAGVDFPKMIR